MAFWGCYFSYNDISCKDFDLMVYDIGNESQSAGKFASGASIVEDTVSLRWKPIFYGTTGDKKLEFTVVFGVNEDRLDKNKFLSRSELNQIANWLNCYSTYKYFEVEQTDLEGIRYKCLVTDLSIVEFGRIPYALKATFTCDSAYAYTYPRTFTHTVDGSASFNIYNPSKVYGSYKPVVEIDLTSSTDRSITIANDKDESRTFSIENIPAAVNNVRIDNDHGIIEADDTSVNLYKNFSFHFLKLSNGNNRLTVSGHCTIRIICEFPVDIGV